MAVIALVLLRLGIGWHFFSEGVEKYTHPEAFSSATFLSQAKGPLAEFFHGLAPDFHGHRRLLARPLPIRPLSDTEIEFSPNAPYSDWAEQIASDWRSTLQRLIELGNLEEEQRTAAADVLDRRHRQLSDYLADVSDEIATYRHELYRLGQLEADAATGALPYHDRQIAQKRAEVQNMPGAWIREVQAMERAFQSDLVALVGDDQKTEAAAVFDPSGAETMDTAVTYIILGVGICLVVGLFTRTAAMAGVLFLLSVIATQPPWVEGASPVYYQSVEMLALVVLATTASGRFAGLDFFVHHLLRGCCGIKRETS